MFAPSRETILPSFNSNEEKKMKIACTGSTGRVGKFMVQHYGLTPLLFDITKPEQINAVLDREKPAVILHTAGLSNPDYCETHYEEAIQINYWGSVNLFRAASERKIITVFLSTCQIFSGKTILGLGRSYKEDDAFYMRPVNRYGLSKFAAEAAATSFGDRVKIVRTSHVFDYTRTMSRFQPGRTFSAPVFIKRNYMYLPHFGLSLASYLAMAPEMPQVLHIAGKDTVSEYDFLRMFLKIMNFKVYNVKPRVRELEGVAPRPHYAGLNIDLSKKLHLPQASFMDGLFDMNRNVVRG